MLERKFKNHQEIYSKNLALLENSRREILPSGDVRYMVNDKEILRYSSSYEYMLPKLLEVVSITSPKWESLGDIKRRRVKRRSKQAVVAKVRGENKKYFALKYMQSTATSSLRGIDHFEAIRALQQEGYLVAQPILATAASIVTEWVEGREPNPSRNPLWYSYIKVFGNTIEELKRQNKIKPDAYPDFNPANFRVAPEQLRQKGDIKRQYISFDPVW